MCELLGMSFNKFVNPKVPFKEFQQMGKNNPHGWGIAYYKNQKALIKKEPINALSSDFFKNEKNLENIISKIIIGHVREKSKFGEQSLNNTHPFSKELDGKDYAFAHNGVISSFKEIKLKYFFPHGETDSEHIFCHLLDCIHEKGIKKWNSNDMRWLEQKLNKINQLGSLNCLFSDGEHLFCYHDKNGYNGFSFIQQKSSGEKIKLEDIDCEIDFRKEEPFGKIGYTIATKPVTDGNWEKFKKGEFIIFKKGKMIYSTYRKIII